MHAHSYIHTYTHRAEGAARLVSGPLPRSNPLFLCSSGDQGHRKPTFQLPPLSDMDFMAVFSGGPCGMSAEFLHSPQTKPNHAKPRFDSGSYPCQVLLFR